MDGTGWGACPIAGFGISGVGHWGSATRELIRYIHVVRMVSGCKQVVKSACGDNCLRIYQMVVIRINSVELPSIRKLT